MAQGKTQVSGSLIHVVKFSLWNLQIVLITLSGYV